MKNIKNTREILVKIHQTYREIVAVCDAELLGKKFEEGNLQIEVNEYFYGGEIMAKSKIVKLIKEKLQEDACFNFVGQRSIELGIKAGIIDKGNIIRIQGIPHAMALL
jgi:hypothetical protein